MAALRHAAAPRHEGYHRLQNPGQATLAWWSAVSPFSPYGPTIALLFVLLVAAVKAVVEDKKRHREDRITNNSTAHVVGPDGGGALGALLCMRPLAWLAGSPLLAAWSSARRYVSGRLCKHHHLAELTPPAWPPLIRHGCASGQHQDSVMKTGPRCLWCRGDVFACLQCHPPAGSVKDIRWHEVRVGQILEVRDNENIPADLLTLHCAHPDNVCFIKTVNLDGAGLWPLSDIPNTLARHPQPPNLDMRVFAPMSAAASACTCATTGSGQQALTACP